MRKILIGLLFLSVPLVAQTMHNTRSRWYVDTQDSATASALGMWTNVKDTYYQAKGDGFTDDRAAIQSAIVAAGVAGGGEVFLPPGTYNINTSTRTDRDELTRLRNIGIYIPYNNVKLIGVPGKTILSTSQPMTLVYFGDATTTTPTTGNELDGITLQYIGGSKIAADSISFNYGAWFRSTAPVISQCTFRNFISGVILLPNTVGAQVSQNNFTWDYGLASNSYGTSYLYDAYNMPCVGVRNFGYKTFVTNNYFMGITQTDFTTAPGSPPDTLRVPAQGLITGEAGSTAIVTGNQVYRASYEGIYVSGGFNQESVSTPSPTNPENDAGFTPSGQVLSKTVISDNIVDGEMPTFTGASNSYAPNSLLNHYGLYGIRADGPSVTISGNIVRKEGTGIMLERLTSAYGVINNFSVTGNTLTDIMKTGIQVDYRSTGSVS